MRVESYNSYYEFAPSNQARIKLTRAFSSRTVGSEGGSEQPRIITPFSIPTEDGKFFKNFLFNLRKLLQSKLEKIIKQDLNVVFPLR